MKEKLLKIFAISSFVGLYIITSLISTIHSIDFFKLSNPQWLAVSLAIAFELGAAASLAAIVFLDKINPIIVWGLFIILTLFQMMGNTYYAYANLKDFRAWVELFDMIEEDTIFQKRILAIISGALLPIIALGFIKSLVDYIKPQRNNHILLRDNKNREDLRYVGEWREDRNEKEIVIQNIEENIEELNNREEKSTEIQLLEKIEENIEKNTEKNIIEQKETKRKRNAPKKDLKRYKNPKINKNNIDFIIKENDVLIVEDLNDNKS